MDDSLTRPNLLVSAMHGEDPTAAALGIQLAHSESGLVTITQPVTNQMLNASGIVHGGYLFLLADTALAYCCASMGRRSVTRSADICFIASARVGHELSATAHHKTTHRRNTIIDVSVFSGEHLLAEFRGHGVLVPPAATPLAE